jgi:glucosyl-3-phosphoglycerate synthase
MMRSIVIPAHNEVATIFDVVRTVRADADEVIVVASACSDSTGDEAAKAGARVVTVGSLGKHHAIRAGLQIARGNVVAFLDGDLVEPSADLAARLFDALTPEVSLAKGYYERARDGEARLTEICARPLLTLLQPSIAQIRDPLSGEYAVVRERARRWPYAPGFAVDLGFLLTASREGHIKEVNLGVKRHKRRSVHELGQAAAQVAVTVLGTIGHSQTISLPQSVGGAICLANVDISGLPPLDSM